AALTVTRNAANQIQLVDCAKMVAKLLPSSCTRAIWVVSVDALAQFLQLADGSGRAAFVPNGDAANIADRTGMAIGSVAGFPVLVTEKLPALGTKGDLLLVDPTLYVIGDRGLGVDASSLGSTFLTNQTLFRFAQRVDGRPMLSKAITLQDGTRAVRSTVILQ